MDRVSPSEGEGMGSTPIWRTILIFHFYIMIHFNLTKKSFKTLCFIVLACSLSDVLFINNFLSLILNDKVNSVKFVSVLMLTKRFSRLLLDMPFGIFVSNKIGLKNTLILSRVLKLFSLLFLFFSSKFCLFLSMILYGAAHVSFYGKFEIYIYNFCDTNFRDKFLFRRIVSFCYFMQDIGAFALTIFGIQLFHSHYTSIMTGSLITILVFILIWFYLPNIVSSKKIRTKFIVKDLIHCLKNPNLPEILLLFGITNALAFAMPDFLQFIMINAKLEPSKIAMFNGVIGVSMSIGCIISLLFCKYFNNINFYINIIVGIFALSILFIQLTLWPILFYFLIYPIIEISLEGLMDKMVDLKLRTAVASTATTLAMIFGIIIQLIGGISANIISLSIFYIFVIVILLKVKKSNQIIEDKSKDFSRNVN